MKKEAEIRQWYNDQYKKHGDSILRPEDAYLHVLDYFEPKQGKRLLDIGCGAGWVLRDARRRGIKAFGVELSDEAIKIAKKNAPGALFSVGSAVHLGFPDKFFDYVTCLGALEHMVDIDESLQEMHRVVKDDGMLCVLVPNENFIYWKLTKNHGTAQQEINEQMFTLKQWKKILTKNGFEICLIRPDLYLTKKIKSWVCKLILPLLPLYFGYAFYFIIKKQGSDYEKV